MNLQSAVGDLQQRIAQQRRTRCLIRQPVTQYRLQVRRQRLEDLVTQKRARNKVPIFEVAARRAGSYRPAGGNRPYARMQVVPRRKMRIRCVEQPPGNRLGSQTRAHAQQSHGRRRQPVQSQTPCGGHRAVVLVRRGGRVLLLLPQVRPPRLEQLQILRERRLGRRHVATRLSHRQRQIAQCLTQGVRRRCVGLGRQVPTGPLLHELQRFLTRPHRHADRLRCPGPVPMTRRDQHMTAPPDRAIQPQTSRQQRTHVVRMVRVVEDQQPARSVFQPRQYGTQRVVLRSLDGHAQLRNRHRLLCQVRSRLLGPVSPDPQHRVVLSGVTIRVLDGQLSLPHAPQPGNRLSHRRPTSR